MNLWEEKKRERQKKWGVKDGSGISGREGGKPLLERLCHGERRDKTRNERARHFFTPRVFGENRAHARIFGFKNFKRLSVFPNFLRSRVFFPLDSLFSFLPRVISAA